MTTGITTRASACRTALPIPGCCGGIESGGVLVGLIVWLVLLLCTVPLPTIADSADLDGDGVIDSVDLDQDNDGVLNSMEGYQPGGQAFVDIPGYLVALAEPLTDQSTGSEYTYRLIDDDDRYSVDMIGTIQSTNALVDWSFHDNLVKLRNQSAGSTRIEWRFENPLDHTPVALTADLTISDLDAERFESIVVARAAIDSYSLAEATALSVEDDNGLLRFTALQAAPRAEHRAVTLHLRGIERLVIDYENDPDEGGVTGISNDAAGYRHSLQTQSPVAGDGLAVMRDSDNDGLADHRDLDSDNDGINDVIEAGGVDADFDAMADGAVNHEGVPSSALGGLSIGGETDESIRPASVIDEDGDGIIDPYDASPDRFGELTGDTDQDGLNDLHELSLGTDINNPDSDADGVSDADEVMLYHTDPLDPPAHSEPSEPVIAQLVELSDADSDGIADQLEGMDDVDDDGLPNRFDLDSDNDGISDLIESGGTDLDGNGRVDSGQQSAELLTTVAPDFDNDGIANFLDTDSDGDGFSDLAEAGRPDSDNDGRVDNLRDDNTDGWNDAFFGLPVVLPDTDNDGNADFLDRAVRVTEPLNDGPAVDPMLRTGVDGGFGCVMGGAQQRGDFFLLLLLAVAAACAGARNLKS